MANLSPIPSDAPIVGVVRDPSTGRDRLSKYMSDDFNNWLLEVTTRINNSPEAVPGGSVSLADQNASIASTPAYVTQASGMFRANVYARVVTAGSVSSSLAVDIEWTDDSVNCSDAFAAVTGNTTDTVLQGTVILRSDQAAAINYVVTYADGGGATAMAYDLEIVVEAL